MTFASPDTIFGVKCINSEGDQVLSIFLIALNISSVTSGFDREQ